MLLHLVFEYFIFYGSDGEEEKADMFSVSGTFSSSFVVYYDIVHWQWSSALCLSPLEARIRIPWYHAFQTATYSCQ